MKKLAFGYLICAMTLVVTDVASALDYGDSPDPKECSGLDPKEFPLLPMDAYSQVLKYAECVRGVGDWRNSTPRGNCQSLLPTITKVPSSRYADFCLAASQFLFAQKLYSKQITENSSYIYFRIREERFMHEKAEVVDIFEDLRRRKVGDQDQRQSAPSAGISAEEWDAKIMARAIMSRAYGGNPIAARFAQAYGSVNPWPYRPTGLQVPARADWSALNTNPHPSPVSCTTADATCAGVWIIKNNSNAKLYVDIKTDDAFYGPRAIVLDPHEERTINVFPGDRYCSNHSAAPAPECRGAYINAQ